MKNEEKRTPRQWLIDVARVFNSEEAALAMSRLLDSLDVNSISYAINERVENRNRDSQCTAVSEIDRVGFDLVINPNSPGNAWLINASMPVELLNSLEEIPSIGCLPAKAYQWLINENIPDRIIEGSIEELLLMVHSMSPARYMAFLRQQEWILSSELFNEDQKAVTRYKLKCINDFIAMSASAREEYLRPFYGKIDFDTLDDEQRFAILQEFDSILRPIIGSHGLSDWTRPEFITTVISDVKYLSPDIPLSESL